MLNRAALLALEAPLTFLGLRAPVKLLSYVILCTRLLVLLLCLLDPTRVKKSLSRRCLASAVHKPSPVHVLVLVLVKALSTPSRVSPLFFFKSFKRPDNLSLPSSTLFFTRFTWKSLFLQNNRSINHQRH